MIISFCPVFADDDKRLLLEKTGDRLRINGEWFDFSALPDGATIPAGAIPCPSITDPVHRIDGEIHVTLILPHSKMPEPTQTFPEAINMQSEGVVDVPQDTTFEESVRETDEGFEITTVATRWHQEPVTTVMFFPIKKKEVAHVDA